MAKFERVYDDSAKLALCASLVQQDPSSSFFWCCHSASAAVSFLLFAIGRGAASTKYATLSSLGNIPVVYMTALNGWVHDRFSTAWMLHSEALLGIGCVAIALVVLRQINIAQARN